MLKFLPSLIYSPLKWHFTSFFDNFFKKFANFNKNDLFYPQYNLYWVILINTINKKRIIFQNKIILTLNYLDLKYYFFFCSLGFKPAKAKYLSIFALTFVLPTSFANFSKLATYISKVILLLR